MPGPRRLVTDTPPSCVYQNVNGLHLPYCLDVHVNVHNNFITNNASLGDELFSGTLSGGGGATFCTGADYYKFNYNWVCGNLSSGEGGGVTHLGFIYDGDIEHNSIVLNQSSNPTVPTNGGGISVQGTPDTDPVCGAHLRWDCPPGLSDGTGPGLVINANLIQGNSADSGAGGGIRMNQVNGTDVSIFPTTSLALEQRDHHQQHHQQQRCRLGWRWNLVAGFLECQNRQQHHRQQRHLGDVGCADLQHRHAGIQRAGGGLRPARAHRADQCIVPAAGRCLEHAEFLEPDDQLHRAHAHVPGGRTWLRELLKPDTRQ